MSEIKQGEVAQILVGHEPAEVDEKLGNTRYHLHQLRQRIDELELRDWYTFGQIDRLLVLLHYVDLEIWQMLDHMDHLTPAVIDEKLGGFRPGQLPTAEETRNAS